LIVHSVISFRKLCSLFFWFGISNISSAIFRKASSLGILVLWFHRYIQLINKEDIIIFIKGKDMGQGLSCYECAYHNACFSNLGVSLNLCCISCWCCENERIRNFRGDQCFMIGGCNQGFGSTIWCGGQLLFIPEWLRTMSIRDSIGNYRGTLEDVRIESSVPAYQGGHNGRPY